MKRTTYLLAFIAIGGLAIAACSDDTTPPQKDTGVDKSITDSKTPSEGKIPVPDTRADIPLPDTAADKGTSPFTCEAKCTAEAAYLCVTDTKENRCVQCKEDGHCAENPAALGPKCDKGLCTCAKNDDCKTNKNGKTCDTKSHHCSCTADTECTGSEKCVGSLFDTKICALPCTKNGDCSDTTPKCDTKTGRCVACLADTDCTEEGATHCNTALGQCAECNDATHCAGNISGNACVDGTCSCAKDSDCTATSWGPKCVTKKLPPPYGDYKECGCNQTTECTANQNGPTCFDQFHKCSCDDDAKCTTTGLSKCNFPYAGAVYKHCQKPCTANPDCAKIKDLNVCNTSTGKCVGCLVDTDCTGPKPFCSPSVWSCVACKADTDCKSPDSPFCDAKGVCVECKADTNCATSQSGSKCVEGSCSCAADTDCKANAWGNKCVTGKSGKICGCSADQECAANQNGPTCLAKFHKCTCDNDAKCTTTGLSKCNFPYAGAVYKHCQKPCTANPDCAKIKDLNVCNTSTGKCVGCLVDTDCTGQKPFCNPTIKSCVACKVDTDCKSPDSPFCDAKGVCVACKTDTNCATSLRGSKCVKGSCGCAADTDCKANAWGNKCVTGKSSKFCGCSADQDCAANQNGAQCASDYGICTCKADTDCKTTGYTKCGKPFSGAPVSNCHKPCTQNTDCKDLTGLAICETTKSICIGCKTATDCTYNAFEKTCQTSSNDCVECLATADCTANAKAFGPKCDTKHNYCVCASSAECASNPNGHVCDSQLEACSCVKDTDCPQGKTCTGDFAGVVTICK